jgi:hypothetical protein
MEKMRGATAHISDGLRRHIEQALINVDNSFHIFEMEGKNIPGAGIMTNVTRIPLDRYAGNVMILANWIIPDMQDEDFKKMIKGKDAYKDARDYHSAIIQLLERQGFFLIAVQRSLAR